MLSPARLALVSLTFTVCTQSTSPLVETPSTDNSDECDCYLTSGPDAGYFQYHRFFDFRNIPNDGDNDFTQAPPLVTNSEDQGSEPITSSYFNSSEWQTDWGPLNGTLSKDTDATVRAVASYQNIYISRNSTNDAESSTYLTLRTNRLRDFQSTAEIDSNQKNLYHSSIRARLRVIPTGLENAPPSVSTGALDDNAGSNASHPVDAGAVVGFFTYESDTSESDIEILTQDPTTNIHYSNQPDYDAKTDSTVPGASSDVSLPDGEVWTEWQDHRIDWFHGVSRWYVNNELVLNKSKNSPGQPSGLILNLWSNGGSWSGNMSVGGQVVVGVEWIELVFNVSGNVNGPGTKSKRSDPVCKVGCWIDGPAVTEVGFPQIAFNSSAAGLGLVGEGAGALGMAFGLMLFCTAYLLLM